MNDEKKALIKQKAEELRQLCFGEIAVHPEAQKVLDNQVIGILTFQLWDKNQQIGTTCSVRLEEGIEFDHYTQRTERMGLDK